MHSEKPNRSTTAMIVALIAVVLAASGTAIAGSVINGNSIKNKSITGQKLKNGTLTGAQIKNFSLPGTKLKLDALTGDQIVESSLVGVAPGQLVNVRMSLGQQLVVFSNGPLSISAKCYNDGSEDLMELYAVTSVPGAVLDGQVDRPGGLGLTLEPTTPEQQRRLMSAAASTGETFVGNDADEGFILAPDGSRITVFGDTATLGVNYFGAKCFAAFNVLADKI